MTTLFLFEDMMNELWYPFPMYLFGGNGNISAYGRAA